MFPTQALLSDEALALPAELRRDGRQRDIVSRGIAMLGEAGIMPALEYLKSHAVNARVIERVLLEPGRRRAGA